MHVSGPAAGPTNNITSHSYLLASTAPHADGDQPDQQLEEKTLMMQGEEPEVAMATSEAGITKWIVDTACSKHLTGDKSLFRTLRETTPIRFKLADSSKHVTATHIGDINVTYHGAGHGTELTLKNVHWSPDVQVNLLSGTQAVQRWAQASY